MALFKKKKPKNGQGQGPVGGNGRGNSRAYSQEIPRSASQEIPRRASQGLRGPSQEIPRRASQGFDARNAPRNAASRGNSQNIPRGNSQNVPRGNSQNIPRGNSQNVPPNQNKKQKQRRRPDNREVRAGSQRRSPIERITPSRGHKPSQHNTSVRRAPQGMDPRAQRMQSGDKRQQQAMQQARQQAMQQARQQARQQPRQQSPQTMPPQQPAQLLHPFQDQEYVSRSVEELRQADRQNQHMQRPDNEKKARRRVRRSIIIAILVVIVVAGGVVGGIYAYNSSLFSIENVKVTGVEHLTATEMTQLANVPDDTTLLRVDTATIADRVKASAWVEDVQVKRIFPDTLELVVTEREMAAVVEIPVKSISGTKQWAIAKDTMWLMPIPERGSEAAKSTSPKIYEDAENVIHIKDLPFGTVAEIGKLCTDDTVNNVMAILSGMTTELADMVVEVSASGIAETTLILNNGVEVAFGEAKDIRDKERVVLEILSQNPDGVSYINVRMVETPTWRAI